MKNPWIISFVIVMGLLVSTYAHAKRSKMIDFEDELVEGVNRLPLDSVTQLSRQDDGDGRHLYRKRKGFAGEVEWTLKGMKEGL